MWGKLMNLDLEQQIRERAYRLWEQDGRMDGRADEYWYAAARELAQTQPATPAQVLSQGGDIIVADVTEPKTRRRSASTKAAAAAAPAATPRRRRSSTTTLSS
jgi:Protein of unknown function (DUF2934)